MLWFIIRMRGKRKCVSCYSLKQKQNCKKKGVNWIHVTINFTVSKNNIIIHIIRSMPLQYSQKWFHAMPYVWSMLSSVYVYYFFIRTKAPLEKEFTRRERKEKQKKKKRKIKPVWRIDSLPAMTNTQGQSQSPTVAASSTRCRGELQSSEERVGSIPNSGRMGP